MVPWNRSDSYVETETLDLTGPRSHADRKSEINHQIRAYSPEGGGGRTQNGELALSSPEALAADHARAPFNFFHLVSAVAKDDLFYRSGGVRVTFPGPGGSSSTGPTAGSAAG
jgi:hypothetical protein